MWPTQTPSCPAVQSLLVRHIWGAPKFAVGHMESVAGDGMNIGHAVAAGRCCAGTPPEPAPAAPIVPAAPDEPPEPAAPISSGSRPHARATTPKRSDSFLRRIGQILRKGRAILDRHRTSSPMILLGRLRRQRRGRLLSAILRVRLERLHSLRSHGHAVLTWAASNLTGCCSGRTPHRHGRRGVRSATPPG
jgi:hypothetical protein